MSGLEHAALPIIGTAAKIIGCIALLGAAQLVILGVILIVREKTQSAQPPLTPDDFREPDEAEDQSLTGSDLDEMAQTLRRIQALPECDDRSPA